MMNVIGKNILQKPVINKLIAGPLEMIYQHGNLRYISYLGEEIVRMIYPAIRDRNWNTAHADIFNEIIEKGKKSFRISYHCNYSFSNVCYTAFIQIAGNEMGTISYSMQGETLHDFYKNRIGLCVLHPIKDCAGKKCEITDIEGNLSECQFPEYISPHQPFSNLKSMCWPVSEKNKAHLIFTGDIFETEDQRNWTDASFKTYSTPLSLPFPVLVKTGEKHNQTIELHIEGEIPFTFKKPKKKNIINIRSGLFSYPFPQIGIGLNERSVILSPDEINILKQIPFSHIRLELKLFDKTWQSKGFNSQPESKKLSWKIELILFFSGNYNLELEDFLINNPIKTEDLYSITIFSNIAKTTPDELITAVYAKLKSNFPGVKIGGGTNAYFAELNRERLRPLSVDFLKYSINPQVHANDNESIIESLEAQKYTVQSARNFSHNSAIHVSPITLKPRFNPNSTAEESKTNDDFDIRQASLFAAGFTVGSIASLAKAGAESVTFFEITGLKGIVSGGESLSGRKSKIQIYPVYLVFIEILKFNPNTILDTSSDNALKISCLTVQNSENTKLFLVNHTSGFVSVNISALKGFERYVCINQQNVKRFLRNPDLLYRKQNRIKDDLLGMPPFAIVVCVD